MKNLIYIISFVFLFACVDKHHIQELKKEVKQDLASAFHILHQAIEKEVEKVIEKYKPIVKRSKAKLESEIIAQTKAIKKKYLETLTLLDSNYRDKSYQSIFDDYRAWMLTRVKTSRKLEGMNKIFENQITFKGDNIKENIKLQIASEIEHTINVLGFEFSSGWYDKMGLLGINQSQKIEEGQYIELEQFIYHTKNAKRYEYTPLINHARFYKLKGNIFDFYISTKQVGRQKFTINIPLKDWETGKDTTLYFTKTFEVIK